MRKTGIADSEFTLDSGTGRVNLYTGGVRDGGRRGAGQRQLRRGRHVPVRLVDGAVGQPDEADDVRHPDDVVRGEPVPRLQAAVHQQHQGYADAGGRMFNGHLHFYWLRNGPAPWPGTANYIGAVQSR